MSYRTISSLVLIQLELLLNVTQSHSSDSSIQCLGVVDHVIPTNQKRSSYTWPSGRKLVPNARALHGANGAAQKAVARTRMERHVRYVSAQVGVNTPIAKTTNVVPDKSPWNDKTPHRSFMAAQHSSSSPTR